MSRDRSICSCIGGNHGDGARWTQKSIEPQARHHHRSSKQQRRSSASASAEKGEQQAAPLHFIYPQRKLGPHQAAKWLEVVAFLLGLAGARLGLWGCLALLLTGHGRRAAGGRTRGRVVATTPFVPCPLLLTPQTPGTTHSIGPQSVRSIDSSINRLARRACPEDWLLRSVSIAIDLGFQ